MTVFIIISLFPRDQYLELFNVGGFPTDKNDEMIIAFSNFNFHLFYLCNFVISTVK